MARIFTGKWRGLAGLVDLVGCDDLDVGPDVVLLVRGMPVLAAVALAAAARTAAAPCPTAPPPSHGL